jgi:hypothetical protein
MLLFRPGDRVTVLPNCRARALTGKSAVVLSNDRQVLLRFDDTGARAAQRPVLGLVLGRRRRRRRCSRRLRCLWSLSCAASGGTVTGIAHSSPAAIQRSRSPRPPAASSNLPTLLPVALTSTRPPALLTHTLAHTRLPR